MLTTSPTVKKNAALSQVESGKWDIVIGDNGDISSDDSWDTDIYIALFADRRADKSEIAAPERRRGWAGDEYSTETDYYIGSKLWLLEQARLTSKTVAKAKNYVHTALSVFVDRGRCQRVGVAARTIRLETLEITAKFYVDENLIKSYTFRMWENSKYAN